LGRRSSSLAAEPIVKPPAGIETILSPPLEPSDSVNTVAVEVSDGFRIPFSSILGNSKLMVRSDGLDSSLLIDGAAIAAPVTTTPSAAIPIVCRRVNGNRRRNNPCCGSACGMADAPET